MPVLMKDHDYEPISLCSLRDSSQSGIVTFDCFKLAQPLEPILHDFDRLCYQYRNVFIENIWKARMAKLIDVELTIPDLVEKLWDPIFKECCKLIDDVHSRNIKLTDIDYYFHGLEPKLIKQDLRKLCLAVDASDARRIPKDCGWIEKTVDLMQQYWSLCNQADAAVTVLELKDRLALTGNFTIVENLAKTNPKLVEDVTLNDVDEKLIEVNFYETFANEKQKLDCLSRYADCFNTVEWLRKEAKGIHFQRIES